MRFGLITVGTEILTGKTLDTNKWEIARFLHRYGYQLDYQMSVHDAEEDLSQGIRWMMERTDVILATGGLGETHDDITARVFRDTFSYEEEFAIENQVGTASGLFFRDKTSCAMIMPGPPAENQSMLPFLWQRIPPGNGKQRSYHICGMSEVEVERLISPHLPPHRYATYVSTGYTSLCILSEDYDSLVEKIYGPNLFGTGDDSLEKVVLRLLRQKKYRVGVVESVTGGMLGSLLSRESGSSDCFYGGLILYRDEAKKTLLGLGETLDRYGAVSSQMSRALAQALIERTGVEVSIGITGYAEHLEADLQGKMHLCVLCGDQRVEKTVQYRSGRERNRERLCVLALDQLRRLLL